jgi:uncharacterized membrane protein
MVSTVPSTPSPGILVDWIAWIVIHVYCSFVLVITVLVTSSRSLTIYRKCIGQQPLERNIPGRGDKATSLIPATRFTGRITRLLALGRRYTGGDAAPLVLGGLFVVVLIAGGVLHHAAVPRLEWMNVNVALAVAPIALATVLFCVQRRGPIWWAGATVFILLLPNTPYILTDVIHLQASVASARRAGGSGIGMGLTFAALFALGILGYTYVVALIVADLRRHRRMRFIWPVLLIVNAACAFGVWLGRVPRLNSWDAVRPRRVGEAVMSATNARAAVAIAFVFVVVGVASLVIFRLTERVTR